MLTRIHIDNYKCFTNFDLRLHNLTLLAGANGCGKSAVFDVMGKLRDFACDQRVDKLFLADDLTRWTMKREQRFERAGRQLLQPAPQSLTVACGEYRSVFR